MNGIKKIGRRSKEIESKKIASLSRLFPKAKLTLLATLHVTNNA